MKVMTPELRQLCDQARQLADKMWKDLSGQAPDTAAKVVALYMFAKGYKSYQAALLLYQEGFWQDAASVARTLLELSFQARWLDKDPDTAGKLFLRGAERDRIKLMKNLRLNGDEETRAEADAVLRELFSSNDIDASWRNWWGSESNIEKLAKEAGYARVYGLQYRQLCWFVHSSPITIRYYLGDEEKPLPHCKPSAPPQRHQGLAETFFSAAPGALMDVLAVVDNVFKLNLQTDFDRVRPAFHKFNKASPVLEKSTETK
jgi:uncharacterized protein DUF5677